MIPSPIIPTFLLVRRAIWIGCGPFATVGRLFSLRRKQASRNSRSSPGTRLEGPQIVSFRPKSDNQSLDRGSPLLVYHVDRDIVAHFVECFFPWLLEIDHFENV